eukprot:Gb_23555 [translate_table: standard]
MAAEKKIATSASQDKRVLVDNDAVNLSAFMLKWVPESFVSMETFVNLDLSNNNLECLPESVGNLVNLTSLDIHSNQLKSLPNSIGKLVNLKHLHLSGNMLTTLPYTIQDALEELMADFNQLERLPETMGFELINMRKLSVHSNKISYLPPSISHMTDLRVLDAHLNKLRLLPKDIGNLVNLQMLNISCNFSDLPALPDSIGGLVNLTDIDLSYNQIRVLPDTFGNLKNLQRVELEGNPLLMPPPEVVDDGIEAVKKFMAERQRQKKKPTITFSPDNRGRTSSLLVNLVKGKWGKRGSLYDAEAMSRWHELRPGEEEVDGSVPTSPRHFFFSPRRLFSPRDSPFLQ